MSSFPENRKLLDKLMRAFCPHHEKGRHEHPVLGMIEPGGFGWICSFADEITLPIPVIIRFQTKNDVCPDDEDNYISLRAHLPALLKHLYDGYRLQRAADDDIAGREQKLFLAVYPLEGPLTDYTDWVIKGHAEPYDGEWDFCLRGWTVQETYRGF